VLIELSGKAGNLCQPARSGELRCPLIVRSASEDVVTDQLFAVLKALNPRWWLADFLNLALGADRFRRQVFRNLKIELWQKQRKYPRHHITWDEGVTEVDVLITWENPPTTVFIEMKYRSPVAATTVNHDGSNGFPADQIIRNARIGLWENGWFQEDLLFSIPPRDFVLLLVTPTAGNPLIQKYRDTDRLRDAIPKGQRLTQLPPTPFIGELSYGAIVDLLKAQRRWFSRSERQLIDQLIPYLTHKLAELRKANGCGH
jgi:hypothetical protein